MMEGGCMLVPQSKLSFGVFTQYEITKPNPEGGIVHRHGFMDDTTLKEWLAAGWTIVNHWPGVKLIRDADGRLKERR